MDGKLSDRLEALESAARELSQEELNRFLQENCATPDERRHVEKRLLAAAATESMDPRFGAPPVIPDIQTGQKLGRYELQVLLGAGGGGKVYRALDPTLRRTVAIKILPTAVATEAAYRRRLVREAITASGLNHPNIVTVYEIAADNGIDYVAMEYIAGKSLRQCIPKRGLELTRFFPLAIQIANALAAAHEAGVVHRDLKPGNVMITDRGLAKVVDFGLAKHIEVPGEASLETVTREGTVMGTFAYMAPEQAEGLAVDARADIFSFGCVLYEMLTGRMAFEGDSQLRVIGSILHKDPPPIREVAPHVPATLERLIAGCLRKNREQRWQNAADVRVMLEDLQQDLKATAAAHREHRWIARWKLAAAGVVGAVVALAAGYYYTQWTADAEPDYQLLALTSDAGLSTAPSLSPDGRLLAYASDRGASDNLDIWIQQIGGHTPMRLTDDPADETDPDISPDGTRIAFRSEKEPAGIYVVPALGGRPVLIAEGGRNPRFSPDGQFIAYWTGREGVSVLPGSAQVYAIASGGGQPTLLGKDLLAAMYPVWSPAGDAVLAIGRKSADFERDPRPDWFVIPLAGGDSNATNAIPLLRRDGRALRVPLWQHNFTPLVWSANGGGRVFFTARTADVVNIWSVPLDSRRPRASGRPSRVTAGTGSDMNVSLASSAAQTRIAFTSSVLQYDLWTIPVDVERGVARGETVRLTEDLSSEFYTSASWDASRLVYATRRGGAYSLAMRDLRSGKEAILLSGPGEYFSPRISGDGQWVAFAEGTSNISRVSTRGGAVTRLCSKCGSPTDLSFDGNILVLEPAFGHDVARLDARTGQTTSLVASKDPIYCGELSRDGKWVVFKAVVPGSTSAELYVSPVNGDKAEPRPAWIRIAEADGNNQGPHWSPAGNVIYYLSDRDGFRCIWARRVDPATKQPLGPPVPIQHLHHARHSLHYLSSFNDRTRLAVAGDMLVVSLGELTGNIWLREQKR